MSFRNVRFWGTWGFLASSLLWLCHTQARAQSPMSLDDLKPGGGTAKRSDAVVKISAQTVAADNAHHRRITLTLKIDEGWYIYANPVGNAEMQGSETVVTVAGNRAKLVKVVYPRGKLCKDKLLDQEIEYRIYEGTIQIEATVEPPPDDQSIELAIKFGACNHRGSCLQPATVKIPVK